MRRAPIRHLITILGVAFIIGGIALFKQFNDLSDLRAAKIKERERAERMRKSKGLDLLSWKVVRTTRGNVRKGPRYDKSLLKYRDKLVDIIGFMVPLYEFRQAHEFLLLPMPIECYFCQRPPINEVMFIQMAEGQVARMVEEPVLINGYLTLNEGPGTKFFYVVRQAKWGPGDPEKQPKDLHTKITAPEHQAREHIREIDKAAGVDDEILPGMDPSKLLEEDNKKEGNKENNNAADAGAGNDQQQKPEAKDSSSAAPAPGKQQKGS